MKEKENKTMNQKERMLSELPHKGWLDGLPEERMENKMKLYEYNLCRPDEKERKYTLIRDIMGKCNHKCRRTYRR